MTNIFKNVRVLLCALAISASTHGAMAAQEKAAPTPAPKPRPTLKPTPMPKPSPTPTPSPTSTPSPTPTPKPAHYDSRQLSLVTETGAFKSEFKSLNEAHAASQGNSYNQTLKKGTEIIVMNVRCADGSFGDKVTFSIYAQTKDTAPIVKSYLDYRKANPNVLDGKQRERAMTDEVLGILSISTFQRRNGCDSIPVVLSFSDGTMSRLEVDDAKSPLVGPKINDGFLHDGLMQNTGLMLSAMGKTRDFWEKYGFNGFSTAQDALNAASLLAGTKMLIYNGTNFSLYRLGKFEFDDKKGDAQYDVFKTTPIRKGWKIVAIVRGKKFVQIYNPNVR